MAINFPNTPATNDTYLAPNGVEYIYNGSKWTPYNPVEPNIGNITASGQLNLSAGGANQSVVISPSGTGTIQLAGNAILSGANTTIAGNALLSGTNTTIGDASTDVLNVNSVATFNANTNFDAGTLFVDGTNNRVGLGTTTPTQRLDIVGGNLRMDDGWRFQWGTGSVAFDASSASNFMTFRTNNAERMRIDTSGNVGIGKSPTATLDVNGPILTTAIRPIGSDSAAAPGYGWSNDTTTGFFRKGAGSIGIAVNGTEEINITAAGTFELNAVSGYSQSMSEWTFNRTTNGAAIGPAAADVFTSPSSVALEASSVYEIEGLVYFLKTTSGTVTWNPVFSAAPTFAMIEYSQSPVTGMAASTGAAIANILGYGYIQSTATTVALLASATGLTTAVNHFFRFRTYVRTNTACNWRLRATSSAGTITPLAGSYYSIRKVAATTGTFAA